MASPCVVREGRSVISAILTRNDHWTTQFALRHRLCRTGGSIPRPEGVLWVLGEGEGGIWDPTVCVPKMAQNRILSFSERRLFGL